MHARIFRCEFNWKVPKLLKMIENMLYFYEAHLNNSSSDDSSSKYVLITRDVIISREFGHIA